MRNGACRARQDGASSPLKRNACPLREGTAHGEAARCPRSVRCSPRRAACSRRSTPSSRRRPDERRAGGAARARARGRSLVLSRARPRGGRLVARGVPSGAKRVLWGECGQTEAGVAEGMVDDAKEGGRATGPLGLAFGTRLDEQAQWVPRGRSGGAGVPQHSNSNGFTRMGSAFGSLVLIWWISNQHRRAWLRLVGCAKHRGSVWNLPPPWLGTKNCQTHPQHSNFTSAQWWI